METEEKIRDLLQPTDDEEGWYRKVTALDAGEAVPILAALVDNEAEPSRRRRMAVLILGLLRDARAVPTLARALGSADPLLRGRAAETLGKFGELDAAIVERLLASLGDAEPFVRESAAKALGSLRRPEALPALERMSAEDSAQHNREVALQAAQDIQRA
jgi:HEAT repeat protein